MAQSRALHDLRNELTVYAYHHKAESPTREEIFETIGDHEAAISKLVFRGGTQEAFRSALIKLAAYLVDAASKSEPK